MLSKTTIKPQRKTHVCTENAILCTRSRLKIVFSNGSFEKRLWLEHVCKVCARLALLLRFYGGSCAEAVFEALALLDALLVIFFGILQLTPKAGARIPREL